MPSPSASNWWQHDVDDEDGPIPNPLQQTYDKRFAQGPKAGAGGGDMRGSGAGAGRRRKKGGSGGAGAPAGAAQPDPMRTAVGYIGADAALKGKGGRRGPRGRGR